MTEQELTEQAEAFVREKGFNGLANHTLVKNWMAEFAVAYADSCNASLVAAHKDIIRITNDGFKSHAEARTLARETSRNAIEVNEKGRKYGS